MKEMWISPGDLLYRTDRVGNEEDDYVCLVIRARWSPLYEKPMYISVDMVLPFGSVIKREVCGDSRESCWRKIDL